MIIRELFNMLYEAVDHMEKFSELTSNKNQLMKKIDLGMNHYIHNNLTLDSDIIELIKISNNNIMYLFNILILGLYVEQGMNVTEAYNTTISKYSSYFERLISKRLINKKFFRKLNNQEINNLVILNKLLIENEQTKST